MSGNLLNEIKERMPEFSKSQRYLGEYILNHFEKASFMTAAKLGQAVNVSESTVVRFANEMGFEGYPEMQRALQNFSRNRLTTLQRLDITSDRLGDGNVLKNILSQDIERIKSTSEAISEESFNEVVEKICNARKIYIYGAMSSNIIASFLDNYFQLIFDNVHYVQPSNICAVYEQLIRMSSEDVFIAISFPRYSQNTLKATEFAKETGAEIIAMTDSESSPLCPLADKLLLAKSDMASFADSLVAPLSVANALIVALGIKKQAELESKFARLEEMWSELEVYKRDC